jgi:hypothetical protein
VRPIAARLIPILLVGALAGVPAASADAASAPSVTVTALGGLGTVGGVACPPSGPCLTVGTDTAGNSAFETITAGQPGPVTDLPDPNFTPLAVACPQSGQCLLAGDELDPNSAVQTGALVALDGATVGPTESVPGTTSLVALACATASACTAVAQTPDGAGGTVALDNGQPGPVVESVTPGFTPTATACPERGGCQLAGTLLTATGTSGAVANATGPAASVPAATVLAGIGCPTSGACVAVGSAPGPTDANGNPTGAPYVVSVADGQPGAGSQPSAPPGGELTAVACASGAECVGVGDDPAGDTLIETISGGRPSPIQAIPADATVGAVQLVAVACPSSTDCLAVGQDADGNPVLADLTLPASAAGSPAGGSGQSGGSPASGSSGRGSGSGSGSGTSPGRRRARKPRPTILTRLRLAIAWKRVVHLTAVTVVVQERRAAGGAGVGGALIRLQLRAPGRGGRWRTVLVGRTGRAGANRGIARLRLPVTPGERIVLRGIAAPDGADAGARSGSLGLVVL